MRRLIFLLSLLGVLFVMTLGRAETIWTAYNQERVTVAATSIGLTASTIEPSGAIPARQVVVTIETAQVRCLWDGTAPTSTTGHVFDPTDTILVEGLPNIKNLRCIRTGATSGVLQVTFMR